jgi:hydroxymethylpyrimidine/phosphomethylpyrimidine kinase
MRPAALTIAGTDPTGGAGIQADLQVFSRCGAHGMAVPTALIVQDSRGVRRVHPVFPTVVEEQLLACFEDAPPAAVKIGALATDEIVRVVARLLDRFGPPPAVLDPVFQASAGAFLLERRAWDTLRQEMIPRVTLITPNLAEAGRLADAETPTSRASMEEVGRALAGLGAPWVLVKGGHLKEAPTDLLVHGGKITPYTGKRVNADVHGTGCALSSAIAAGLALGMDVPAAVARAHAYVQAAIATSEPRGRGARTLNFDAPY